jgi:hypothetical protein
MPTPKHTCPLYWRSVENRIKHLAGSIQDLKSLVEPVNRDTYKHLEAEALEPLPGRDEEDWPILEAALSLCCVLSGPRMPISSERECHSGLQNALKFF